MFEMFFLLPAIYRDQRQATLVHTSVLRRVQSNSICHGAQYKPVFCKLEAFAVAENFVR